MTLRVKLLITFAVLTAIALCCRLAWSFAGADIMRGLFPQIAASRIVAGVQQQALAEDVAIRIYFCGTGAPLPDPHRASACTGVVAGDKVYVFDAGPGSVVNLRRMRFPINRLNAVFITHLHSDHIGALGELLLQSWVADDERQQQVAVYGPAGTAQMVRAWNLIYAPDTRYRIAHHNTDQQWLVPQAQGARGVDIVLEGNVAAVVVDDPGESGRVVVRATGVEHAPVHPALGYRLDYLGRSLSISGDTVKSRAFEDLSHGVDVMIHEALNAGMIGMLRDVLKDAGNHRGAALMHDVLDYHATPVEAAQSATAAGAGILLLTHIVPPLPSPLLKPLFMDGVSDAFAGRAGIAEDGMIVDIKNNGEVVVKQAF